jgi:hypothetical protein
MFAANTSFPMGAIKDVELQGLAGKGQEADLQKKARRNSRHLCALTLWI